MENNSKSRLGRGVNRLNLGNLPREEVFDGKASPTHENTTPASDRTYEFFESIDDYKLKRKAQLDVEAAYGGFSAELHAKFESEYRKHTDRTAVTLTQWFKYKETKLESNQRAHLTKEFVTESEKLPKEFTAETAARFYHFYDMFGTDVATSVIEGGHLQLKTLIDRSKISSSYNIRLTVEAEYDAFFKMEGDVKQTEAEKHFTENRIASLSTEGGDNLALAGISLDKITSHSKKFKKWEESVETHLATIGGAFHKTYEFIRDEARRNAAERAFQHYLTRYVRVTSNWQFASLVVGGAAPHAVSAAVAPAIKVLLLNRMTLAGKQQTFALPPGDPSTADIDAYWQNFRDDLTGNTALPDSIVLLATERWPRDRRFCPPAHIREFLRIECGASNATLESWREDTAGAVPCPAAGVTYGLVGHGARSHRDTGGDCYAIGFGDPEKDLLPTVEISAYLSSSEVGDSVLNLEHKSASESHLITITSYHFAGMRIVVDKNDDGRVILEQGSNPLLSTALWYPHPMPSKYGVNSVICLFNARTGKCLKWDSGGASQFAEAVLSPYAPNLDINLWENSFPKLRSLSYNAAWCLRGVMGEGRVAVGPDDSGQTEFFWIPQKVSQVL